jgi:hypothetical protein
MMKCKLCSCEKFAPSDSNGNECKCKHHIFNHGDIKQKDNQKTAQIPTEPSFDLSSPADTSIGTIEREASLVLNDSTKETQFSTPPTTSTLLTQGDEASSNDSFETRETEESSWKDPPHEWTETSSKKNRKIGRLFFFRLFFGYRTFHRSLLITVITRRIFFFFFFF